MPGARSGPRARARLLVELPLAGLVALLLGYSSLYDGLSAPNERSRAYLTYALVEEGTLSIDASVARFGPVADIARYEGRLYTDKAPGASLLGVLPYLAYRVINDTAELDGPALVSLMRRGLMLPLGVLSFLLFRALLRRLGMSPAAVDIASLSFALGSAAFHYAAAFFGHALVSTALLAATYAWLRARDASRDAARARWLFASGLAVGVAGLVEYQAIIPAALLFALVAYEARRRPRDLLVFALGAAPAALALLAYNDAAFGHPLALPYEHLRDASVQAHHLRGVAGVGLPRAEAVFGSLLSLHRGLIASSPIVLVAPLGLYRLVARGHHGLALFLGLSVLYFLAFIFGADMWFGGWGYGPRLLVPVYFSLFALVGVGLDSLLGRPLASGLVRALAVYGLVSAALVTETFAELPPNFANPLADAVLPALAAGLHSPNLLTHAGQPFGLASLAPAWALTGLVVAWLSLVGLERLGSARAKAKSALITLLLPLAALSLVAQVAPKASPAETEGFLRFMAELEAKEAPRP